MNNGEAGRFEPRFGGTAASSLDSAAPSLDSLLTAAVLHSV
jgi:hypothetical protein